jgi:hypothetical protein
LRIQNVVKKILQAGFVCVLSLIAIGCEEDGNKMTGLDLSSEIMGGALDAEIASLIPDYETIDTRLRVAHKNGKVNPKDVERVRGRVSEYRALEARIKASVEAGTMTRKEAGVALARAKKEMFGAGEGGKGRDCCWQADW